MDSGAAKTIVPRDAIPGMKLSKSKGGCFRMANGNIIPNLGEAEITGSGSLNTHPHKFGTQVADVTKPLAAASEAVDGGRTIILHRTGGIVKKLNHESEKKIRDIIKAEEGPEVILERKGGGFTYYVDAKREKSSMNTSGTYTSGTNSSGTSNQWETPKKTVRRSGNQGDKMEIDVVDRNQFDPLWEDDEDAMNCGDCNQGGRFHRQ